MGSEPSTTVGRTNQPSVSSAVPPARTVHDGEFLIRSSAPASFVNDRPSITAPPKLVRSVTSPYASDSALDASRSRSPPSHRDRGTYALDAAEHFCPWHSKAPRISAVWSPSTSAEECAMTKSLPP